MDWIKRYEEMENARLLYIQKRKDFREIRDKRNNSLLTNGYQECQLQKANKTLDEWREAFKTNLLLGMTYYDALVESSEGCLAEFEFNFVKYGHPELRGIKIEWNNYRANRLGNGWDAFYLIRLKDGFVYFPLRYKNSAYNEIKGKIYKLEGELLNGDYIKTELYPYLEMVLKHYDNPQKNHQQDKCVNVLNQILDTMKLRKLFK